MVLGCLCLLLQIKNPPNVRVVRWGLLLLLYSNCRFLSKSPRGWRKAAGVPVSLLSEMATGRGDGLACFFLFLLPLFKEHNRRCDFMLSCCIFFKRGERDTMVCLRLLCISTTVFSFEITDKEHCTWSCFPTFSTLPPTLLLLLLCKNHLASPLC